MENNKTVVRYKSRGGRWVTWTTKSFESAQAARAFIATLDAWREAVAYCDRQDCNNNSGPCSEIHS